MNVIIKLGVNMFICAQITRIISFIFEMISAKAKDSKNITLFNGIGNFFLGVSYLLLNAITGAICSFIAMIRNYVFYKYKNKLSILVLLLYFIIILGLNYFEIHNLIDIIPVTIIIVFGTAMYYQNCLGLKLSGIFVSLLEIVYDYYYHSYIGIIICVLYIILVVISLYQRKKE